MTPSLVCVSNADSGDISILRATADGHLTVLPGIALGGVLMPMATNQDGSRLYVARRSEPFAVLTLAVDKASGSLRLLGETPLPASMAYIATDRHARHLLAASYPGHMLTVSPIADDGTVGPVLQTIPTGPHAHAIVAAPSNRHVLATSLGADEVLQFHFDARSGRLTPNDPPCWRQREGAGPRHLCFHPNGRFVYLLNELDATLDVLSFDADAGTLRWLQTEATAPPGLNGKPWAADLHITPDGRHLFTCERHSSTLCAFAIDGSSGRVRRIGRTDTEQQPRGFAIGPEGRTLLVAGQASHHLSSYSLDPLTGELTLRQREPVGRNPNWVLFLP
ncbi:lactonase family protein [Hydrogenophaga sp.]|uniref:lactonase family protein n=1 Tax=Hydrogenophaga sp. TaxID=1904254 RepID=UPI002608BCD0|nr:lactonase family protein [Hydrogenophaga sp.]MCW5652865.1 lactonase family protein [Hydrogenophaga sp.]